MKLMSFAVLCLGLYLVGYALTSEEQHLAEAVLGGGFIGGGFAAFVNS